MVARTRHSTNRGGRRSSPLKRSQENGMRCLPFHSSLVTLKSRGPWANSGQLPALLILSYGNIATLVHDICRWPLLRHRGSAEYWQRTLCGLQSPKHLFTIWPFTGKVCQPAIAKLFVSLICFFPALDLGRCCFSV